MKLYWFPITGIKINEDASEMNIKQFSIEDSLFIRSLLENIKYRSSLFSEESNFLIDLIKSKDKDNIKIAYQIMINK